MLSLISVAAKCAGPDSFLYQFVDVTSGLNTHNVLCQIITATPSLETLHTFCLCSIVITHLLTYQAFLL